MNRAEALAIRSERVKRARKFAGYTQKSIAHAMRERLGEDDFSYKMYLKIEKGERDLSLREADVFMDLTGATKEFLTGDSDIITLNRPTGLYLGSPVRVAA